MPASDRFRGGGVGDDRSVSEPLKEVRGTAHVGRGDQQVDVPAGLHEGIAIGKLAERQAFDEREPNAGLVEAVVEPVTRGGVGKAIGCDRRRILAQGVGDVCRDILDDDADAGGDEPLNPMAPGEHQQQVPVDRLASLA